MDYSLKQHVLLALFWIMWCGLHSLLIAPSVTGHAAGRLGDRFRYYRLFFVVIALTTIIPVFLYRFSIPTISLFDWQGYLRIIQGMLIMSALYLFLGGAGSYDLRRFMGIRQAREGDDPGGMGDKGDLKADGVLGMVRHPWYLGGILIIWSRPLDSAALVSNLVLTT